MEDDDKKLPLNYLFKIKTKEKEIIFIFYSNNIFYMNFHISMKNIKFMYEWISKLYSIIKMWFFNVNDK